MDLAVLALLRDAERYGGEVVSLLSGLPGLDAGPGTVYPVLARLRTGRLVSTSWRESASGPPRKYYAITPAGRRVLAELAASWRRLAGAMSTLIDEPPPVDGPSTRTAESTVSGRENSDDPRN
jgi:PadR family transcriptional regulator PadR